MKKPQLTMSDEDYQAISLFLEERYRGLPFATAARCALLDLAHGYGPGVSDEIRSNQTESDTPDLIPRSIRSHQIESDEIRSNQIPQAPPDPARAAASEEREEKEEKERSLSSSSEKSKQLEGKGKDEPQDHTQVAGHVLLELVKHSRSREGVTVRTTPGNVLALEARLRAGADPGDMVRVWRHVLATWSDPGFVSVASVYGGKWAERLQRAEGWEPEPEPEQPAPPRLWEQPPGPEDPLSHDELVGGIEALRSKLNWGSREPERGGPPAPVGDILKASHGEPAPAYQVLL
jgi:hypothetical protein